MQIPKRTRPDNPTNTSIPTDSQTSTGTFARSALLASSHPHYEVHSLFHCRFITSKSGKNFIRLYIVQLQFYVTKIIFRTSINWLKLETPLPLDSQLQSKNWNKCKYIQIQLYMLRRWCLRRGVWIHWDWYCIACSQRNQRRTITTNAHFRNPSWERPCCMEIPQSMVEETKLHFGWGR